MSHKLSHRVYDQHPPELKRITPFDLGEGINHMIEDGPGKWDLIVAFADSVEKGTTVDFQIVVFRGSFPVGVRIKCWISALEHADDAGQKWNFAGKAAVNSDCEIFQVRGVYNVRNREGRVSRNTA